MTHGDSNQKIKQPHVRKAILSTLWIFTVLNYLYCDVLSLMDANLLKQYLTGTIGGMHMSQGFLLGASILMEISIAMVLLCRITKYGLNRALNIIAGIVTTFVQAATLLKGNPTMYYLFFSTLEIACTAFIVWYAWTWKPQSDIQANPLT